MEEVTITLQPYGRRIVVPVGTNLLEAIRQAGVGIRSICGGRGNCGKCKVIVRKGKVDFKYNVEEKLLSEEELSKGYVLACLSTCISDCEIFIPPETRIEGQRIQTDAVIPKVAPEPAIKKVFLHIEYLSPEVVRERLKKRLGVDVGIREPIYHKLNVGASPLDEYTFVISSYYDGSEVIDVEEGNTVDKTYGLAVDIGTTKIVAYLVELNTGKILGSESEYNRQLIFGEDVVSRISYAMERKDGLSILQQAVVDTINSLISRLAERFKVSPREIYDVCVAGNTVMTYLFVGRDPSPLLETNVEISREPAILDASTLRLNVNPLARVYCLPCVSRFLGGDAIGDVLLSGMYESPEVSLLIDIGTNVEVVLGGEGWFLATTAAAGPAFEGWGIKFGIRSVDGAIASVRIDPKTLKAKYEVIGGGKPKGICGSGLIDLVSELFRLNIIDSLGKFNEKIKSPYVRMGEDGYEYVVAPKEETAIGMDIVITEKDIANLIDSKSAACAAIAVLLKKMRLSVEDVTRVYICGAFGSYMDLNSATAIGLIPEFPNAKMVYLGNGSVAGAYLTLVSTKYRREGERVARLVAYFDLLKDADFMDEYLAGFVMPGKKELFPSWWETSRRLRSSRSA